MAQTDIPHIKLLDPGNTPTLTRALAVSLTNAVDQPVKLTHDLSPS